ncbi:hypothetical protein U1Q18_017504 [Sarracenia purpurea var. burkii]
MWILYQKMGHRVDYKRVDDLMWDMYLVVGLPHELASDEVTGTKIGEMCQISLEGAKVSLTDVDYTETRYYKRVHNQEDGIIEDDGELTEANQQSAKEENDKYSMVSNFSIINLNCEAKASTVDLHPHLQNECLTGNRVFEKSLTDTLEVVNLSF